MEQPSTPWSGRGALAARRPEIHTIDPLPPIASEAEHVVRIADLELDPEWHAVSRHGRQIALTRIQFQLLALLAEHVNHVVCYDRLVAETWGFTDEASPSNLVKSHISRLRRKLGLVPFGPLTIKASPGRGYMLRLRPAH
ncbi:MAG: response regulator transcription factor [Chloroflexi bacterium]|nr:response regulator transcription factor [Chloroflexota bacterium]